MEIKSKFWMEINDQPVFGQSKNADILYIPLENR